MKKEPLELDKPSYVGMSILDLSKVKMYDFLYNYIKKKYNERAKLLFTDTDSLCYHIKTDDAYEDFNRDLTTVITINLLSSFSIEIKK